MADGAAFQKELIVEEYKACRERIGKEIDIMNTLETTFVLAIGAIIAFDFTKDNKNIILFRVSMAIIMAICTYCYWRYGLHRKIIRIHEAYIEEFFEPLVRGEIISNHVGLVTFYNQNKSKNISEIGKDYLAGGLKKARYAIWVFLKLIATSALLFSFVDPSLYGLLALGCS